MARRCALGSSRAGAPRRRHLENNPIDRDRSQNGVALGYGYNAGGHTVQVNVRHDEDSEFGGKGTGSVAYGYAITPQWRATASVGTAFRAPTLYQRFSQYGVASLSPETARNAELGLRYAQGSSSFSVVAFRNRVRDLISFAGAGPCASTFGCYANTARAEYKGVTFAASHRIGPMQLHGSLDVQRPRDLDTGKQLARRAKHHGTFGADAQCGWLDSGGPKCRPRAAALTPWPTPTCWAATPWSTCTPAPRIARDYTLLARVDNLTDKDYQLARDYAHARAARCLWA